MKYRFNNTKTRHNRGFTLVEAIAAMVVVGIITSSVLVVFIRSTSAVRDSIRKIHAFEVVRENMETLLAEDSITQLTEYGYSEKYPSVLWTTKVETFYEPVNKDMWLRAICSADYEDHKGQMQTVELTHWLTKLDEKQVEMIEEAREELKARAEELGLTLKELMELRESTSPTQPLALPGDTDNMTPDELRDWIEQQL